jgi:hypothetical protein
MRDPLEYLTPSLDSLPASRLRQRVLTRTLGEMRWNRRFRRLQAVGVLAASFAASFVLLSALLPRPERVFPERSSLSIQGAVPLAESANALEWQALEQPQKAQVLYRQAGDRYLEEVDPASAVRCYGAALDGASREDLKVSADDNWLLAAIKQARKQEAERCDP